MDRNVSGPLLKDGGLFVAPQKMKLWWIPQVPMKAFEVEVANLDEGVKILTVLADYDIFQLENNIKPDYCNVGGLSFLDDDGEWRDWYDEDTGEDNPCRFVEERDALALAEARP